MGFVHLHNHSHYSVLDGAIKIKELVEQTVKLGMNAVALTDHGNMCGAIEFYKAAKDKGVKPIIGQEFYIAPDNRFNRKYQRDDDTNYHLVLLAENMEGYHNLLELSSSGFLDGFYYKPRIDWDILSKHSKGLICSSACLAGEIPQLILKNKADLARKATTRFVELFGKERFFLELQDHNIDEQRIVNKELVKIASEYGVPLIASNDTHYLQREDAHAHEILLCIQTGKVLSDTARMRFPNNEFYFKSPEEMEQLFAEVPDALYNTGLIADMVNLQLDLNHPVLPTFQVPEGHTLDSYLRELTIEGAHKHYSSPLPAEVMERIEFELKVIISMGFPGYFLIVRDFINYARSKDIPVGPGRGSAAGSIVSYCLGITQLDPLKYNLLFERFLNPDRKEMPDMDIDFCGIRREEVIEYVRSKYGEDHVTQIMAFNTMKPKAAVKDVARVLEIPFNEANQITKLISIQAKNLPDAIKSSPDLKTFYESGDVPRKLLDISIKLEGLVRSFGKHAAGVVISKDPLTSYVPLYRDTKDGGICAQYEKGNSEAAGLVKMDFLGLKNLSIIDHCVRLIEKTRGTKIDLENLPLDDQEVYALLRRADTDGIFQLESQGMKSMLRRLGPTCFDDIIAAVALYRPGPLQSGMAEDFITRKRHPDKISYPHPSLEPVLSDTLGVIVYQEQVMKISQVMGGFTLAEADALRKAMGKKKVDIVNDMRDKFLKGARDRKINPALAEEIYDAMSKFAEYGFNKSHAAAYSLVTFQTAYLKAHYLAEYMTSLLTFSTDKQEDITKYIGDARAHGVQVLPPDVNNSVSDFSIENEKIRFGFYAIKGIGEKAIESIVESREKLKGFKSLKDFFTSVDLSAVNKGTLEGLIKSGAFVSIEPNRAFMMHNLDKLVDIARNEQKEQASGQGNLFAFGGESDIVIDPFDDLPRPADWMDNIKLGFEKEFLGLYLSGHPLARYEKEIRAYSSCSIQRINELVTEGATSVTLAGVLENVQRRMTRAGNKEMAIARLEDMDGTIEVLFFPKTFQKFKDLIVEQNLVLINGKIETTQSDEGDVAGKIFAENIQNLREARYNAISALHVNIDPLGIDSDLLEQLKSSIATHKGRCPVFFHVEQRKGRWKIVKADSSFNVQPSEQLVASLQGLLGENTVRLTFRNAE